MREGVTQSTCTAQQYREVRKEGLEQVPQIDCPEWSMEN